MVSPLPRPEGNAHIRPQRLQPQAVRKRLLHSLPFRDVPEDGLNRLSPQHLDDTCRHIHGDRPAVLPERSHIAEERRPLTESCLERSHNPLLLVCREQLPEMALLQLVPVVAEEILGPLVHLYEVPLDIEKGDAGPGVLHERAVLGLRLAEYSLRTPLLRGYPRHRHADRHEEQESEGTHGELRGGHLAEYGAPERRTVEEVAVHHGVDQPEGEAGEDRGKKRAVPGFHDRSTRHSQVCLGARSLAVRGPHYLGDCGIVVSKSDEVKGGRQGGQGLTG
jgi:hypothetical protein